MAISWVAADKPLLGADVRDPMAFEFRGRRMRSTLEHRGAFRWHTDAPLTNCSS